MLIVLPPSETKAAPPSHGATLDLGALSFPSLMPMRSRIIDALVTTSARPDALARLTLGPSAADEVAGNIAIFDLPTRPVLEVYAGVLHDAVDAAGLSTAARRRAEKRLVVVSALWGVLRPVDRVAPYRLPVCADLVGVGPLEATWRPLVGPVLAEAAGPSGLVVDLRSSSFLALGRPQGLASRTVVVRVVRDHVGGRSVGGHIAKRTRGEIARQLLESAADPQTPGDVADVFADRWEVGVAGPTARDPDRPSTVSVVVTD